jgi:hypothetical protein
MVRRDPPAIFARNQQTAPMQCARSLATLVAHGRMNSLPFRKGHAPLLPPFRVRAGYFRRASLADGPPSIEPLQGPCQDLIVTSNFDEGATTKAPGLVM